MISPLASVPDDRLLSSLRTLVRRGNAFEAELLTHLGEVDARRLYAREGCSSMFTYCVQVLHFAESSAYKRITAARAARRHPELLADQAPRPDVPASIRQIGSPDQRQEKSTPKPALTAPSRVEKSAPPPAEKKHERASSQPLGGERYCVRFTADRELHTQIQELRALMRHQIPDGDVGKILARAVSLLLEQVRKRKLGETHQPKAAKPAGERLSRHVPAAVRRAVSKRDGECCTYVSPGGRRCGAKEFLEFHHAEPWARSRAHAVENLTLRCRAHNQYAGARDFGERHMARFRGNWI